MSTYVYGVIPATAAPDWPGATGIDGPVRLVTDGELAALVSELAPDHTPGRREDIEAHRRVLSLATASATTVPMRFGIVMDDEDEVRERLLEEHGSELADLVHKLDGHVQMTVRAYYAEDALLAAAAAADPAIAQRAAALEGRSEIETRDERIALGQMVAEAVTEQRGHDEQALLDRLAPLATEVRVDPPGGDRVALNAHLLVRRERRPALDAVVHELGKILEGVLAIRYIGPLPPYSFADVELEPDDGTRAGAR